MDPFEEAMEMPAAEAFKGRAETLEQAAAAGQRVASKLARADPR
jgi:hypothetical protein